jgi:nucleoside-diphosphate-sugar epimerase
MYLVTGGTGLIGSYTVYRIVQDGSPVVVYDAFPEATLLYQILNDKQRQKVKVVKGDVTDLPSLLNTVKDNKINKIIHMASLLADASEANPPLAIRVNCEGTNNVFEAARLFNVRKVVWASSITVFGPPEKHREEYIPNDAPHFPFGVYGACKSMNEAMAARYNDLYGMDIVAIRYTTVYGPGQKRGSIGSIISELVGNPATGKPGRVPYGDDTIGWLYADDAARATLLACNSVDTKTKAFTLSGELCPIKRVAEYVRRLLPDADITLLPGRLGIGFKYDTTPIKEEIGYQARWSMEEGIKATINIVRMQHGLPAVNSLCR